MRVLFVLASLCGLSLAACGEAAVPGASQPSPQAPTVSESAPRATPATLSHDATATTVTLKYVALGDSYTIGTSVKPHDRWPNVLMRTLNRGLGVDLIANLAVNGATSQDLIDDQLDELQALNPGFVSILIGVNDVVRGVDADTYGANMRTIFRAVLDRVPADRILVVTTPDYTLTPQGTTYGDPDQQSARIATFNQVLTKEAARAQLVVVDITPVADQVADDASLVAADGLHPSGKQYAAWVELIAPAVRKLLRSGSGN